MLITMLVGCGGGGDPGSPPLAPDASAGTAPGVGPPDPSLPMQEPAALDALQSSYANHPEYARLWGLGVVHAARAYARLSHRDSQVGGDGDISPGQGTVVALIDDGIDPGHWELDNPVTVSLSVSPALAVMAAAREGRRYSHGTSVAGVIAARRGETLPPGAEHLEALQIHGVAWGVQLEMTGIHIPDPPSEPYQQPPVNSLLGIGEDVFVPILQTALRSAPDILNLSIGINGLVENYSAEELRRVFGSSLELLAQDERTDKTLIVVAAGNANNEPCELGSRNCSGNHTDPAQNHIVATSPELVPGLPVRIPELRGHFTAVVAVDSDGEIADFSNRCGVAAPWCMAAPGGEDGASRRLPLLYYGPDRLGKPGIRGYTRARGTSFAAPFVSGGLAVLRHWFRDQLSPEELLSRLFETAAVEPDRVAEGAQCPTHLDTDGELRACELSSTLGRGLMDLDAATAPQGALFIGGSRVGSGVPADSSFMHAGMALGDAMTRAFAGLELAVFDSLGAPFWTGLDGFGRAPQTDVLWQRLYQAQAYSPAPADTATGVTLGLLPIGRQDSHLSLAAGGLHLSWTARQFSMAAFSTLDRSRTDVGGVKLAWQAVDTPLGITAGWLHEGRSLLQSTAGGAFGGLSAHTLYSGLGGQLAAGDWQLELNTELGAVVATAKAGLLDEISTLYTSAFTLAATRRLGPHTQLRLTASQPLRVEQGRAVLHVPIGRTRTARVLYEPVQASLAPSGRQLDISAAWLHARARSTQLAVELRYTNEPGHNASAAADCSVLTTWRVSF